MTDTTRPSDEDRRLAEAARRAGFFTDVADDAQVAAAVRSIWSSVRDAYRQAAEELTAAWRPALKAFQAAAADLIEHAHLQAEPDPGQCHCLCPMHPQARGICGARHDMTVTLIGGMLSPREVPMCAACAVTWQLELPERVSAVAVREVAPT